jgi:hypothetical protein
MAGDDRNVTLLMTVTGESPEGKRVTVEPGNYTMRELDGTSYVLADVRAKVATLRLAEVILYRRSGALLIDGGWPIDWTFDPLEGASHSRDGLYLGCESSLDPKWA